MFQPFAYYKTEIATLAPTPVPVVTLPSGAVVVYDFGYSLSWPGSGRFVYDLSGNNFTGSMTGSIGSGSAGGLSFDAAASTIQVGNGDSTFYNYFDDKKQMYLGIQYETGSMGKNTSFVSTWDTVGTGNFGYAMFINGGQPASDTRTGVQLYNVGGTGATGYYNEPVKPGWITGSVATLGMMLNVTSGSFKIYNNNSVITTKTGLNTSLFTSYGTANGDAGKGFRLGNRLSGENFLGQFKKFVAYNRALSDDELGLIQAWMTSSAPTTGQTYTADYLIVGGGGGGGIANESGGGGAGGLLSGSLTLSVGTTYPFVVGQGGSGSTAARRYAIAGSGSYFNGLEARGGGANGTGGSGGDGGSGAGGWYGSTAAGLGVAGQGNDGGTTVNSSPYPVAGGGGASQVGGSRAGSNSGNGGSGSVWLNGVRYAGGGGGGATAQGAIRGLGGPGGGGNGGNASEASQNGTPNTGGGGGTGYNAGTTNEPGGNGGDGVVIIRYPTPVVAKGGNISVIGGFVYHTFTTPGSGSFVG